MKGKLITIGAIVLALALLLTLAPACGNGEVEPTPGVTPTPGQTPTPGVTPTATPEVKTVKMGLLMPLTGMAAAWGVQFQQGFESAIDRINEAGGFKVGNNTYVIKAVMADSKFVGSAAATEATRLVYDENVHYVVGPIITHFAVEPILKEGKCFFTSSGTDTPLGPEYPYSFMMPVDTISWHRAFWAQFIEFHPTSEMKTYVLMSPDTEQYAATRQGIVDVHTSYGHELLFVKTYAQFAVDFYPVLTTVVAANPDIVDFDGGGHGDNDLMVKQLRELGYTGQIVGPMHGEPYSTIGRAGCEFTEGFIINDPDYLSEHYSEETREIARDIMRRYPEASLALTTYLSYNAVEMFVAGMQWVDSIDPDEVMKAFDDPDFEYSAFGISGRNTGCAGSFQ